jgi:hypothetical protein
MVVVVIIQQDGGRNPSQRFPGMPLVQRSQSKAALCDLEHESKVTAGVVPEAKVGLCIGASHRQCD